MRGLPRQLMEMEEKSRCSILFHLTGCWRQMADGNGQTGLRGKLLQLYLPQSAASPIGTASISKDEQLVAAGIESLSPALPPPSDAFHGKLGGLMVNAHIDKPAVMDQIIDAIRNRFPVCEGAVIIDIHRRLLPFGLPFSPVVLEIANHFFLLPIHRNHGQARCFKGFSCAIDLLKLGVSIGMHASLNRLFIRF